MEFTFNNTQQIRQLFVQKHSTKKVTEDKPFGKTLLVINVPPYINEDQLRAAFQSLGSIESVFISENSNEYKNDETSTIESQTKYFRKTNEIFGFKIAHIVFKLTKSVERALKLSKVTIEPKEDGSHLCTGIAKWNKQYMDSLIDETGLQAEVNDYMKAFDEREHEERLEAKKTEVDDDGWTVVKRGKAGGGFQQKESILKALEDKMEKGKEKKEFDNFYAFQIRQSKQKHIVSLRKKFAQDKLKIEAMKKARRFKPF